MKTPVVILHGWAKDMTGQKYSELAKLLQQNGYTVYTPDLPGFGKNPLTQNALFFEDYLQFVYDFLTKTIKTKKAILIGHSFGGRIAIRFAAQYPELIEKLILVDASGIPEKLSVKKKIFVFAAKIGKPLFSIPPLSLFYNLSRKVLYKGIGEMDYYKAGNLTGTFKNVYKVSVVQDLPKIAVPTLVLWGGKDTFTPLSAGKLMHERIKNSKFAIIQDASHRLPYENPEATARKILLFLS